MQKLMMMLLMFSISFNSVAATQVKGLFGGRHNIGSPHRENLRFDVYNKWAYGDSLLWLEINNALDNGTAIVAEWAPRVSLSKVTGHNFSFGFVKDTLLAGQVNYSGTGLRAYLLGIGFALNVPHFKALGVNIYNRNNPTLPGSTYQITPYWKLPFAIQKLHFVFFGHADIAGFEGPTYRPNQLIQPRLVLDIGDFFHAPNKLFAGLRWTYWHHNGGGTPTENVKQAFIMWQI